jgi:hypothetical protein
VLHLITHRATLQHICDCEHRQDGHVLRWHFEQPGLQSERRLVQGSLLYDALAGKDCLMVLEGRVDISARLGYRQIWQL